MRKLAVFVALAGLAIAIYLGNHHGFRRSHQTPAQQAFTDLNGNVIRLSDYNGKVLLVNFWAAWCVPCREEIPQFIKLQDRFRDQGFQVIGISIDDTESELRDFYRKHNMNYPVIPGDQKTADAFGGVLGLPTTFIMDREDHMRGRQVGSTNFQTLEQQVSSLLQAR
jgi:cytochrome c biogenesis protein CcmG, thiol:disulfide interchange protein DsbE